MIGRILTRLFALFGMTLTCVACYGVEYSEFHAEFGATGRVVDPEGNPIKGIEASVGDRATTTDDNGWFFVDGISPELNLEDVDGEANGSFESRTITLGATGIVELGDVELKRK
ncbi:MAG: hypothetical protein IJ464_02690 [Alistipes sp.]|nr:hypothetical protein [Alistipes sp.]